MSRRCASFSCCNHENPASDISYFRFPKQPERFKKWVLSCGRLDLLDKDIAKVHRNTHLCARHFTDTMCHSTLKNNLFQNAVPTIFDERNIILSEINDGEEIRPLQNSVENVLVSDSYNIMKEIEWKINVSSLSQSNHDTKHFENSDSAPASPNIVLYQAPAISKNTDVLTGSSTITKVAMKNQFLNPNANVRGVIAGTQTPGYFNTHTLVTHKLRQKIKKLNAKIRMLQTQSNAMKNSKMTVEEAMEVLRPKLSDTGFLFLKTMLRKSNFESYSDAEKAFFLKLFSQGRRSYNFLNKFCINIPHHKSLQRWMKQATEKQNALSERNDNREHIVEAINIVANIVPSSQCTINTVAEDSKEADDGVFQMQIDESLLRASVL